MNSGIVSIAVLVLFSGTEWKRKRWGE